MFDSFFSLGYPRESALLAAEADPCQIFREEKPMRTLSRFLQDESAATAVEYGLIASLIALGIIASVNGLGTAMKSVFETLKNALS